MSDHSSSRDLKQAVGGVREPVDELLTPFEACAQARGFISVWLADVECGVMPYARSLKRLDAILKATLDAATASPAERSDLTRDDQKTASEPLPFDPDTTPQECA